ncbi:hypothetical protein AZOA_04520 [Azoarcus sp. Aa7]|nr:hypothetical protein [Azoarcus sp. Aa7]
MNLEFKLGPARFEMPPAPFDMASPPEPALFFTVALESAKDYIGSRAAVLADKRLSDVGKDEKMEPLTAAMADRLGHALSGLENFEDHLAAVDAELMAVAAPVTPFEISQQKETREWWRSLPNKGRLDALDKMKSDPVAYRGVIHSLLNSPIPGDLHGHELAFIEELHRTAREHERPDLAVKLRDGRAAQEWARRGFGHLRGLLKMTTGIDDAQLLRHFAWREGGRQALRALGFTPSDIERAQMAAKRRAA